MKKDVKNVKNVRIWTEVLENLSVNLQDEQRSRMSKKMASSSDEEKMTVWWFGSQTAKLKN